MTDKLEKKSPKPKRQSPKEVDQSELVRDPEDIDPESESVYGFEAPRCFGHYSDGFTVCEKCPFLDTCIVEALAAKAR